MDNAITIDQFASVVLKIGKIISAEGVEKSNKLLLLNVDLGDETRVIFSGIRKHYEPEQLVGRGCVVVANLEPRPMMGMESNGMLVCTGYTNADGNEVVEIVEPPVNAPLGTRLT